MNTKLSSVSYSFLKGDQLSFPSSQTELPLVIEPKTDNDLIFVNEFISKNKEFIMEKIHAHGAVLFRGFSINSAFDFQECLTNLGLNLCSQYPVGLSPRKKITEYVFSSSEMSNSYPIHPHTEMAYLAYRPKYIAFFCFVEPTQYGETPIFNFKAAYESLSEKTQQYLRTKKIKYRRCIYASKKKYRSNIWKTYDDVFGTTDKAAIEKICRTFAIDFKWVDTDKIQLETVLPGVVEHPQTHELSLSYQCVHLSDIKRTIEFIKTRQSLFTRCKIQIIIKFLSCLRDFPIEICWGDDTPISEQSLIEIYEAIWKNNVIFPWKKGDILILDNIFSGHGRLNVVPPRRILAALGNMYRIDSDGKEISDNSPP